MNLEHSRIGLWTTTALLGLILLTATLFPDRFIDGTNTNRQKPMLSVRTLHNSIGKTNVITGLGFPDTIAVNGKITPPKGDSEFVTISYTEVPIENKTASLSLTFQEGEGLVKVLALMEFHSKKECMTLFGRLEEKIDEILPQANKINRSFQQLKDIPFCNAVILGKASKISQWTNRRSKINTTLYVGPLSNKHVSLLLEKTGDGARSP